PANLDAIFRNRRVNAEFFGDLRTHWRQFQMRATFANGERTHPACLLRHLGALSQSDAHLI
ncbi:MAG: hypothetical protein DME99_09880, partial [Verrucomicrobia bacterium]